MQHYTDLGTWRAYKRKQARKRAMLAYLPQSFGEWLAVLVCAYLGAWFAVSVVYMYTTAACWHGATTLQCIAGMPLWFGVPWRVAYGLLG